MPHAKSAKDAKDSGSIPNPHYRRLFLPWPALAHCEGRARFVEGMLLEKLLQVLGEKLLLADFRQRRVVMRDQRFDVLERGAHRVLAEIVIERLEIEKCQFVQRPGRLVEIIGRREVWIGSQRRDQRSE